MVNICLIVLIVKCTYLENFVYLTHTSDGSLLHRHLSVPVKLKGEPISMHASRKSLWPVKHDGSDFILSSFILITLPKVRGPACLGVVCEDDRGEAHVPRDVVIAGDGAIPVLRLIIGAHPSESPTLIITNILQIKCQLLAPIRSSFTSSISTFVIVTISEWLNLIKIDRNIQEIRPLLILVLFKVDSFNLVKTESKKKIRSKLFYWDWSQGW